MCVVEAHFHSAQEESIHFQNPSAAVSAWQKLELHSIMSFSIIQYSLTKQHNLGSIWCSFALSFMSVCFIGKIDNVNVDTKNKQMSHVNFSNTIGSKIIPGYKVMYKVTLPSDTPVGHRINM